jgi:hypothetical protein
MEGMMNEAQRKQRNTERLTECFPTFGRRVAAVITELEDAGLRPRIQDTWRSISDQLIAVSTSHAKLKFGFHNVTGTDGEKEALAVDLLDDNAPTGTVNEVSVDGSKAARNNGLQTGILWGLPKKLQQGVDEAIAAGNFDARVKVGWDPAHIEPTGITAAEARSGKRPL